MSHDLHHHLHHQIAATTTSHHHHQSPSSENNSNNNNTTYRPCSPDLSAYSLPPQHQHQQNQQAPVFHPSYQDASFANDNARASSWHQLQQQQRLGGSSAALTGLPGSGYPPVTHRGSYDASPYFSPQASFSLGQGQSPGQTQGGYFVGGPQHPQVQRRETFGYGSAGTGAGAGAGEYSRLTYSPTATTSGEKISLGSGYSLHHQQPAQVESSRQQALVQPPASGFTAADPQAQAESFSSSASHPQQQQQPQDNMPPSRRKRGRTDDNDDSGDFAFTSESSNVGGGAAAKHSKERKSDNSQAWTTGRAPGEVGPSLGIDIKTKFPVARIKRIMQADEDVGKVAQATPTAVCECFTIFLICCLC